MKQVVINNKCNQCGICAEICPEFFAESDNGNIYLISESISETSELLKAVSSCPVGAIKLGADVNIKETLNKYVNQLESMKSGICVNTNDIAFSSIYSRRVSLPSIWGSGYYRSSSAAERAGYDAFCSKTYSQIDNAILERITDYRVSVIKPYYSKGSDSVYTKNNKKVEDVLKAVASIVGSGKLSSDFCTVNVYPKSSDTTWKMLERGQLISDDFIGTVKSEFSYSASDYKCYIDTDEYEGVSIGGRRAKIEWRYEANEACGELEKDLGNALGWAKREIEERALSHVSYLVDMYNKELNNLLNNKINAIRQLTF